ncbi:MAG: hypothetical protein FD176_866 [Rhodospirillaceae bacterium]|nr:MAG: hypothetical protein FD176_866 [Rhodospirillaceae bacterium]TNC97869.1 MAG: hypothetical protein FD119_857 [Stygiobacter sp.]
MIQVRLSGVVQLIDGYSRQPAEGAGARFRLDGRPCLPHAKPQAFYAFTGLKPGPHLVEVSAPGFFPGQIGLTAPITTDQPLAEAIALCRLDPDPAYPYPAWATVIRGQVRAGTADGAILPLSGATIIARYRSRGGKDRTIATRTAGGPGDSTIGSAYDGRYALALTGTLPGTTVVALTFSAPNHADRSETLRIDTMTTTVLDVVMDESVMRPG